jgi:hypothetical protein
VIGEEDQIYGELVKVEDYQYNRAEEYQQLTSNRYHETIVTSQPKIWENIEKYPTAKTTKAKCKHA